MTADFHATPETTLLNLLNYLGIESDQADIKRELSRGKEIEIYGHLPATFLEGAKQFKLVGGGDYDFMNSDLLEESLHNAFYVGGSIEDKVTIEMHTPSRTLGIRRKLKLDSLEQLSRAYSGNFHFPALNELWDQGLITGDDPGEYLTFTIAGQHLSGLLDNPIFLNFIQEFSNCVNRLIEKKIMETMEKIGRLHSLKIGDSLTLNYLDLNNLTRNFISVQEPEQSSESGRVYYFNRKKGFIREVYQVNFKPSGGEVVLTRANIAPGEAQDLQEALGNGRLFYFRDFAGKLMKKYFDSCLGSPSKKRYGPEGI